MSITAMSSSARSVTSTARSVLPILDGVDQSLEGGTTVTWADWLAARMQAIGFDGNSDLARVSGVPDSVISRWRTSGTTPSIGQLRRLQGALQVSLMELLVAAGHVTAEEARITGFTQPERPVRDIRDAIRLDPELGDELKHLLEVQYDAMVALARARGSVPAAQPAEDTQEATGPRRLSGSA
jgi:transcriptional regulator with XRE-family HTH domain